MRRDPVTGERIRWKTEGVAKTGQVSPTGTTSQGEHEDGRVSAIARPATIRMKLKDLYEKRDVKWQVWETPAGKPIVVPRNWADGDPLTKVLEKYHGRNA